MNFRPAAAAWAAISIMVVSQVVAGAKVLKGGCPLRGPARPVPEPRRGEAAEDA